MFHNLCAKNESQKIEFERGNILLNSWELLCFVLSAHIDSLPSFNEFYQVPACRKDFSDCPEDDLGRLDDGRLAVIVLTKLMDYCQEVKFKMDVPMK